MEIYLTFKIYFTNIKLNKNIIIVLVKKIINLYLTLSDRSVIIITSCLELKLQA
jgi:hypothetical protein